MPCLMIIAISSGCDDFYIHNPYIYILFEHLRMKLFEHKTAFTNRKFNVIMFLTFYLHWVWDSTFEYHGNLTQLHHSQ